MAKSFKSGSRVDAVIAGMGLSGLVAGAILARRGKKVIILPEEASSSVDSDLPFFPQKIGFGLERDGAADRILNELGISISLLKRTQEVFRKKPSFLQVIFPFYRFTLYHDRNETFDDLKAGFGERVQAIKTLLQKSDELDPLIYPFLYDPFLRLDKKGEVMGQVIRWMAYRGKTFKLRNQTGADFCKGFGLEEDPLDFFNALSIFYYRRALTQISALQFLQMLFHYKREPLSLAGGVSGLKEVLLKIIKDNKGEVWPACPDALFFESSHLRGMEVKGKESVGCDVLIMNPEQDSLFEAEGRRVISYYYLVPEAVIPSMMGDFIILKRDPGLPYDETNFLLVSLAAKENKELKEEKKSGVKRGVMVQSILSGGESHSSGERLRKEIEAGLTGFMPFAEERMEFCKSISNDPKTEPESYLPKEMVRKARKMEDSPFPVFLLGKSVYYLPSDPANFFVSPFLLKRGYELSRIIKNRR
jgi:hypothetical protein